MNGSDLFQQLTARYSKPTPLTPDEQEYHRACETLTNTRLSTKFGPQDHYADWEIEQACDELEAEGAEAREVDARQSFSAVGDRRRLSR
jgi:hypothetical protein